MVAKAVQLKTYSTCVHFCVLHFAMFVYAISFIYIRECNFYYSIHDRT